MKKSDNSLVGQAKIISGGVHGGGWTTSIRIADDGWSVCRNDTETGGIRGPIADRWTQLHRFAENVPYADFLFRGAPGWIYDVDICKSDSTRIVMASKGRVYKSSDRGATFAKLAAFKSGNVDTTLTFQPDHNARLGGNQVRIDPVNKDYFAIGHPVDGGYVTTDGGTTIAIPASLPAPINSGNERRGVHWAFDRSTSNGTACQTVYCLITGRGVYRSTTGLGGAFTLLSGGPTKASSMEAANGQLFVCGESTNGDSTLYRYNGSWSTPTSGGNPVTGMALAIKPDDPAKIICMTIGGGMHYSSNGGSTWTFYDYPGVDASGPGGECPWLNVTGLFYISTGAIAWDARVGVNDLVLACGIGTFRMANPPRTSAGQKFVDNSRGIKQMLLKNAIVTPKGTLFIVGEDRPLWRFGRGKYTVEATGHGPNYDYAIRHGGDIDFAPEDENYVVGTYDNGGNNPNFGISTDNGRTWVEPNTAPYFTRPDGNVVRLAAGNIAVTGIGQFIWAGTSQGPLKRYDNGSYSDPVFRDESNNLLDMSNAIWHNAYQLRRKCLVSDKAFPGRALIYFAGIRMADGQPPNSPLDYTSMLGRAGLYETLDHGATFKRIRTGNFLGQSTDFFAFKLRMVPGNGNHLFVAIGNVDSSGDPPVSNDPCLYFSSNVGAGMTVTTMTGFREVEDVAFTPRATNRIYPRINVKGWRTVNGVVTHGIYYSDDFNPASPLAATWTLRTIGFEGQLGGDFTLAGDMGSYPGLVAVPNNGGFYADEYGSPTADRPYRVRAS